MKYSPYIGITGFTDKSQVQNLLDVIGPKLLTSTRRLMCGVLLSEKTLNGLPPSNPKRYSEFGKKIFVDRSKPIGNFKYESDLLNLVHYNSRNQNLSDDLIKIFGKYENIHGFQLNIVWPNPKEINKFKEFCGETFQTTPRIVIQVSGSAYSQVNRSPIQLVEKLKEYSGVMTDILFDLSGGKGKKIDIGQTRTVLEHLYLEFGNNVNICIAGGLGPNTLESIRPLLIDYPNLSTDSESNVRTEDELDNCKCQEYCNEYLDFFQK